MYCLRCGRQIPEGMSFCDACKETVSQPLEESPFLSTRIVLPARVAAKSPVKPMPEIKKKKEQERVKSKRLITAVVLLSLLCALLTAACGYGVKLWLDGRREHRLLLTAQEENGRLTAQISAKDDEIDVQKDKVSQLSAQLDELASEITHLEQQINAYKMQGSEVDQSLREMQDYNLRLTEEKEALDAQVKSLEQQLSTLKSKVSELESKNDALETKSDFVDRHVVFIENDGTGYYHSYSCSRFKKQSYWAYSTNLAISQGYKPCPDCQ